MHPDGYPIAIFTANQWVVGGHWYTADEMISLLDQFKVEHPYPSWPLNQWINNFFVAFRPQIEELFKKRDEAMNGSALSLEDFLQDHEKDVISYIPISFETQQEAVQDRLKFLAQNEELPLP